MRWKESPVLTTVVQVSLYVIKIIAIWIFLRGHQLPGGGFIAGLVVAAAITLQGLAFGASAARSIFPAPFWALLGGGLAVALSTVVLPTLFGHAFMKHFWGHLHLPLFGDLEWATAAVFDLGVFLVVVGTAKSVLLHIAEEKQAELDYPGEAEQAYRPGAQ